MASYFYFYSLKRSKKGIRKTNLVPIFIKVLSKYCYCKMTLLLPVPIAAQPNIPATSAKWGSTHLSNILTDS